MAGDQADGLTDLLNSLVDAAPTVPDELTQHLLRHSGVDCRDERTLRLVSLAAEAFLAGVLEEAAVLEANRGQATLAHRKAEGLNPSDRAPTLRTEDVAKVLQQHLPPYHVQR